MNGFGLQALGVVSVLGWDNAATFKNLAEEDPRFLTPHRLRCSGAEVLIGALDRSLPPLPPSLVRYDCRNHRLALVAYHQIEQVVEKLCEIYGRQRIGVVLGSSTAGLEATEKAYAQWKETGSLPPGYDFQRQHAMGSVAGFLAEAASLQGPAYTVSTACTSSSKAMASARDLLSAGFCDAVITGGVDTLCDLTLNGFHALGALAGTRSLPMSKNRAGLNIGEAAALFVMTREPGEVNLCGVGESSDAHHMTAPHPEGLGALAAMQAALADAGLDAASIEYLNFHGTGTRQNDSMEARAVAQLFPQVPCSSTKPYVGHTLGAAGGLEAAFCWLSLKGETASGFRLPSHVWDSDPDPGLPPLNLVKPDTVVARRQPGPVYFMSNSFAFGGNNCSLILGYEGAAS